MVTGVCLRKMITHLMIIRETCFQCALVTKTRNFVSQDEINGTGIKWVLKQVGSLIKFLRLYV